jgi:hypothetical protein
MKKLLISATAALCLAACNANTSTAPGSDSLVATPGPIRLAAFLRAAPAEGDEPETPAAQPGPVFVAGEGVSSRIRQQGEYYELCATRPNLPEACAHIIPVERMLGLEIQTSVALDGKTPLVTFKRPPNSAESAERQSLMIRVFMELLAQ